MAVTPIWPAGSNVNEQGEITFHGRTAESLLNEFGSPLYVIDTDDVRARATKFVKSAANAFNNTVTHVSFAGKALLSKEICRIVTESGMLIDTCTMGEMRIGQGRDAVKQYLKDNPDVAQQIEEEIRRNSFKLMSSQSQVAARAAGRAVDVSAEDFEDGGDNASE